MNASTDQGPCLALLGATGKTGREVLRDLLTKGFDKLKIYVRSKDKLLRQFPDISSERRIEVHVGSIHDEKLLENCLSGVDTIICTLGNDGMEPDWTLSESARTIVTALGALKDRDATWQKPRLIYLSSGTLNEWSAAATPKFLHWLIQYAFQYGYNDLRKAQRQYMDRPDLVSLLLVQPNVLLQDPPSGHLITTEAALLGCSYPDLGRAFVELALNEQYKQLHAVSVSSKNGNNVLHYVPYTLAYLTQGIFVTTCPGGVQINRFLGRWWSAWGG